MYMLLYRQFLVQKRFQLLISLIARPGMLNSDRFALLNEGALKLRISVMCIPAPIRDSALLQIN